MADIHVIKEVPISLAEMRQKIEDIKKRDKELSFRAKKTDEYLNLTSKQKLSKAEDLKKDLQKLGIERLKPTLIVKVMDILPKDMDSLRAIFSNESLSLKEDDYSKILNVVKEYV